VTYDDLGASGERHLAEFDRCAEHVEEACVTKAAATTVLRPAVRTVTSRR
jgi:hypothetical protein